MRLLVGSALALTSDRAHLWYVRTERHREAEVRAAYLALLNDDERARYERLDETRHEFLLTRALCRTTLSRYAAVAPAGWRFALGPHGRPEIATPGFSWLRFNLTNTRGLVACIVARDHDVGVDAEELDEAAVAQDSVVDSFFSPCEANALRELSPHRRPRRFLESWTLKEAYVKARGVGLSVPLAQLAFLCERDRRLSVSFGPAVTDEADAWHFATFRPSRNHVVAAAIRPAHGGAVAVELIEANLLAVERDDLAHADREVATSRMVRCDRQ